MSLFQKTLLFLAWKKPEQASFWIFGLGVFLVGFFLGGWFFSFLGEQQAVKQNEGCSSVVVLCFF